MIPFFEELTDDLHLALAANILASIVGTGISLSIDFYTKIVFHKQKACRINGYYLLSDYIRWMNNGI